MARRRYDLEGSNDFLIAAIVLLGLGLWAIKDGWFPSARVLERHPRELHVRAPATGAVVEVRVIAGQTVLSNQPVAVFQIAKGGGASERVDLRSPTAGTVLRVDSIRREELLPGDIILSVAPDDIFYSFNKSLAVISLVLAVACLFVHRAVR
ncbi:MAG: hypothetical protein N2652_00775 [Kiritimatiellae bacterium]|nr:hypothetical protein [Kiritimatiellia bacterium]